MSDVALLLCECGCGETAPIAKRDYPSHGVAVGEQFRFVHGHNNRLPEPYIVGPTGCWEWQGYRNEKGYGLAHDEDEGKTVIAHRLYYERVHGPVPDGLQLDHLCRNPACVNPAHLEPVTALVNRRRQINTRLTPALVAEIRASSESNRKLAARLGVSRGTVSDVRTGRTWREVA